MSHVNPRLARHLGYADSILKSPSGSLILQFEIIREPPHGDGIFRVSVNGSVLPGEFWGRNVLWSKEGDRVAIERKDHGHSTLCVFDVRSGSLHEIARNCSITDFKGQSHVEVKRYDGSGLEILEIPA
jgi:hypothetical protein